MCTGPKVVIRISFRREKRMQNMAWVEFNCGKKLAIGFVADGLKVRG